jgi:hypothetical protein
MTVQIRLSTTCNKNEHRKDGKLVVNYRRRRLGRPLRRLLAEA